MTVDEETHGAVPPGEFADGWQCAVDVATLTSADDWPVQPEMSSTQAMKFVHTAQQLVLLLPSGPFVVCVRLIDAGSRAWPLAGLLMLRWL